MKCIIELLEQRKHLSITPAVYRADVAAIHAEQRVVNAELVALNKLEAGQRRELQADLKRLHMTNQGKAALNALTKQEASDLKILGKDTAVFTGATNRDIARIYAAQLAAAKHPANAALQSKYLLDLSQMQSDISADQQAFLNQLYSVSADTEIADLNAIGALTTTDNGIPADVATDITGIQTAATPLDTAMTATITSISNAFGDVSSVKFFGTQNLFGFNFANTTDPLTGAALKGLATDVSTEATNEYRHGYPFGPAYGDFAGTDQVYVGSNQTAELDGYSSNTGRVAGPQVVTLDYNSLVKSGQAITSLTLGIATDDFQAPYLLQPYTASINGVVDPALTALLNNLNETGPDERYVSIGIDPAMLNANNVLTVTIDEGGNGGDGWATDFFTVGMNG